MPSIVIAAHNEEVVIRRTLDAVLDQESPEPIEVIVSANGCTDRTVVRAARPGVVVLDRSDPGKAAALNAGDLAATSFPRIYLDADILMPQGALAALIGELEDSAGVLAVVPRRRLATAGRPWPVRAFVSINEKLPAYRDGLFGRGLIALSERGRARFDTFPTLIADDLFLDALFTADEKSEVASVVVVVDAPSTTRDLIHRLARVRRGNAEMRAAASTGHIDLPVRSADRWAWLREVVLPEPRLLPAAVPYVVITVIAGLLARRQVRSNQGWKRAARSPGVRPSASTGPSA